MSADAATPAKPSELEDVDPFAAPTMDPLLRLLRWRFAATSQHSTPAEQRDALAAIKTEVVTHRMQPYIALIADALPLGIPQQQIDEMATANAAELKELDEKVVDAEKNLGDSEVRDALLARARFLARIGNIEAAVAAADKCAGKTLAIGQKLDLCFLKIRLGIAVGDNDVALKAIEEAKKMQKQGDWERRNRLRIYEGLYRVMVRNFADAAKLLLDGLSTFAATELLDNDEFVFITVIVSFISLKRPELKAQIVDSPDVMAADVLKARALVSALYLSRYGDFLSALYQVCLEIRKCVFLAPHVNYFFREGRIIAFNQFLDSYRSVTLQSMGETFKIAPQVLDQMLFTFISNGRLNCKIDRVSGNVVTTRGDQLNHEYQNIIRDGDLLLHKMQKLSRFIEAE